MTGLSALALKRQLGVSYPTAWLQHQKINRAMTTQDANHQLGGTVQLDDAYHGGERKGGKVGGGSENNSTPRRGQSWSKGLSTPRPPLFKTCV